MSEVYFRQWLAGRDFAALDEVARNMRNFTYAIGDPRTHEAVLVDPAYHPGDLLALLGADGYSLVGVIATHYHADHIGGSLMGHYVAGIAEIGELHEVPIHVHADESLWVRQGTGVTEPPIVSHPDGDVVCVGDVTITLRHTPGHTAGSQCLLFDGKMLTGDTLFLDGCGRTDLPGSDPREMYRSLHERLVDIDDDTLVYPGHFYSPQHFATMGQMRRDNRVLTERSREDWLAHFS